MDGGVPIGTCLMLFGHWLQEMKDKKGFKFPCEDGQKQDQENSTDCWIKWCTFVTWSGKCDFHLLVLLVQYMTRFW